MGSFNITDHEPAAQRLQPLEETFQPLDDRVLVRRISEPQASIIWLPSKPSVLGVVVRSGPGKRLADGTRQPLDVKPGDIIQLGRYTDYDDGTLLLIREADVVGIVNA